VFHGFGKIAFIAKPLAGAAVQVVFQQGARFTQLPHQVAGKQMVVAVPVAFLVKLKQKQSFAFDLVDHFPRVAFASHGIAQIGAKTLENAGFYHKVANRAVLWRQHFLTEIICHRAVATADSAEQHFCCYTPAQSEAGEFETGNPALRLFNQGFQFLFLNGGGDVVVEKLPCFHQAEFQVLCVDFCQLAQ